MRVVLYCDGGGGGVKYCWCSVGYSVVMVVYYYRITICLWCGDCVELIFRVMEVVCGIYSAYSGVVVVLGIVVW